MTSPVYVYIDESGDFEFSDRGTDHFVLSAYITSQPTLVASKVLALKYELMKHGLDRPYFHATEDSRGIRLRVLDLIEDELGAIGQIHSIYGDKHLASPKIHSTDRFYALFAGAMAKYLCKAVFTSFSPLVIVYDRAVSAKQRGLFLKTIKPQLKELGRDYKIHFDSIKHDPIGQVADYVAWSHFRALENGDAAAWDRIKSRYQHTPFNIFERSWGHRYW